jgi:hypothetical protein
MQQWPHIPAISGIDDASNARVMLWNGVSPVQAPALGIGLQAQDDGLDAIAALPVTDGNIIVGNGTTWVAESGNTARTSLGLGTGDSPTFTALTLSNGQIVFPASQVASAGANTLDDYEEGTFTPTIGATSGTITTSSASGTYTKTGNRVQFDVTITITTNGTGAGAVTCTLPFTCAVAAVANGRENAISGSQIHGFIPSGGSTMNITAYNNGYPSVDGVNLILSGQYRV